MILLDNISKSYNGNLVLNSISLQFEKNKSIGIVGRNGSGKTTLVNIALGLTAPSKGTVKYLFKKDELCRIVGVQMQDGYFESLLKVKEICELICCSYKIPYSRASELMDVLGISSVKNRYLTNLSGGERQKVNILLSILHDPKILFYDEITTGLDAISRNMIYKTIKSQKDNGKSIILVSHYFEEIWEICDYLVVLEAGELIYSGEVKSLATDYTAFNKKILDMLGGELK